MAISIDWGNKIIHVPKSDLIHKGGVIYELDVDWLRKQLKDLEDSDAGMVMPDTHRHTTEVSLSGVTYARFVEIINGYQVEFEDGQYVVWCSGANHNLADVKVPNQVSLIIGNAAGLIKVETGISGLTPEESARLMETAKEDGGRLEQLQAMLLRILGLVQENFRLTNPEYDSQGNLVGATIKVYPTAMAAQADLDPLATYRLTAAFQGNRLQDYLVTRLT